MYVHSAADLEMARDLIINAKCQRPGVCNAIENILIDKTIAAPAVPLITTALREHGVEIRGDELVCALDERALSATPEDWDTEYLALIISIKCVSGIHEAIAFTNAHSSQHSDTIITADTEAAELYLRSVDSACDYHNASTRFTDGSQFGLGAEVCISTNRLHARGPMGINELCTYKYVLRGDGQVRT
jgi:glutamate-5-semialdehyde dehydrogenase